MGWGDRMICIDKIINYSGALIKVTVNTANDMICGEILGHSDILKALEVVEKHGGCRLVSENPIKIVSGDGGIEIVVEPANFFAKMFWGMAVDKVKESCKA